MNHLPDICVCGAGTMGSGIAGVFAARGYRVTLFDISTGTLERARRQLESDLTRLQEKQKITAGEKELVLERLTYSSEISHCKAKLIIEAIIEDMAAKTGLINHLFSINDADSIIATNTSSLPVGGIADRISEPSRFAGMHFFNPAGAMKLVEIVRAPASSEETIQFLLATAKSIGKTPVVCRDSPGFIVNRVARPYYIESLYIAEHFGTDIAVIDRLMEASGFRMGPFKLMDLIGNDVNFSVSNIIYQALNKPERLRPSALQQKLVNEGNLGRKSGKGYYDYST